MMSWEEPPTWQCRSVTSSDPTLDWPTGLVWLTISDLATQLDLSVARVRRLFEERILLATRVDGVLKVPADFLKDGEPLTELRGTLTVLADMGFSDEEAVHWMVSPEDSLGTSPVAALREGRKAEVRRVAQALGF
jgi:hypothetical protein